MSLGAASLTGTEISMCPSERSSVPIMYSVRGWPVSTSTARALT